MAIELDPIQLNRAALSTLKLRRARLFRTSVIPFSISLTLFLFAIHLDSSAALLLFLPSVLAGVSVAVAIHRVVLIDSLESYPLLAFGAREMRFVGAAIGVGVLAIPGMLLTAPLAFGLLQITENPIPALSNLLVGFPCYYMVSRFSLVLPVTALDRTAFFMKSWRDSFGSGLRLTFALMIPSVLSAIFSDVWAILLPSATEIPALIFEMIASTFSVAVLSLAFQRIERETNAPAT